jgi:hypothetical protein
MLPTGDSVLNAAATDTQATDTGNTRQIHRQYRYKSSDNHSPVTHGAALFFAFIDDDDNQRRLRQTPLIILLLQYHNNIQDCHYLLRSAIVQPQESPWRSIYINADETSFLHLTGLSRNSFAILLDYLFDLEDIARHRRRGRPCSLYPDDYLFYLGSTMNYLIIVTVS